MQKIGDRREAEETRKSETQASISSVSLHGLAHLIWSITREVGVIIILVFTAEEIRPRVSSDRTKTQTHIFSHVLSSPIS